MKITEAKLKQKVEDRWWPDWGFGVITKVLKTRIVVEFKYRTLTYDKDHLQFLNLKR